MASEPVVVQVLEGEGAIAKNREVMGATNPADAAPGTIRADFAQSVGENSVHGSDAPETAAVEIAYFFSGLELVANHTPVSGLSDLIRGRCVCAAAHFRFRAFGPLRSWPNH